MRLLRGTSHEAVGFDVVPGAFTTELGTLVERDTVARALDGCDAVLHAATLHKPHVATHSAQDFVDTNVTGTLNLLEEAVARGGLPFVFTSTTSTFGRALVPPPGEPAAWITEAVRPVPKNIYGVTKTAAEELCELFHLRHDLPCLVLKTARFFPETDDDAGNRARFDDLNLKVNELLHRRLDIEDAARAHLAALERAPSLGFGRYILSATTPFTHDDLAELRRDAPTVVARHVDYADEYARRGWTMTPTLDRIYVNDAARRDLGWEPRHDFAHALERLRADASPFSELMHEVGAKGYHPGRHFEGEPFPTS